MLLGNGNLLDKLPLTQTGGVINNTNWMNQSIAMIGLHTFKKTTSLPDGYGGRAFNLPMKAGGISSVNQLVIIANGYGAMGVTTTASSDMVISMDNADGELIVSGFGDTTFEITSNGSVVASLNAEGSTSFTIEINHLAMYVDAYGWAGANLDLVTICSGTLMAIAICNGSTADNTGLSPASIWNYWDRTLTESMSGGLTATQAAQLDTIEINTGNIATLM